MALVREVVVVVVVVVVAAATTTSASALAPAVELGALVLCFGVGQKKERERVGKVRREALAILRQ